MKLSSCWQNLKFLWHGFFLKLGFLGPKVHLFCPKSVPQTGNELAGDDTEISENTQLTLTNLSHL